ncbi:MAG: Crp/Fnr family transcriptional regulator [Alphaproteobacteria bacterium]|nr:Crp/Fnr family transcriptional regulator [Alphaproteobacteria bacterium]
MDQKTKINKALRALPVLEGCPPEVFERFVEGSIVSVHDKGKILFLQDEPAERFYLLLSGWAKLFRETLDGAQAVVDVLSSGDLFGETAIFYENEYPFSAEIVERAELVSLPLALFKSEVEKNGAITLNTLHHLARHNRKQGREIEHLALQSAPQRIGCFLLRLFDQTQGGPVTIHLPYDKTLIAARLGMQPETFSRALKKLRTETDIDVAGSTVTIGDIGRLSAYSCGGCSSGFPCDDLEHANCRH